MTNSKLITSSPAEKLEDDALLAGEAMAVTLRGLEIAPVVLLGLLVCPPLAILVVLVVVPAPRARARRSDFSRRSCPRRICSSTTVRGHHDHLSLLAHRLRRAARALVDLLPHRIVADARKLGRDRRIRHLRPRGNGETQQTTTVELFFDLVYVFAVTQLSHQILGDLSVAGVARAAFLLLVVWWAWIYTTWMANWFDPTSSPVRAVLTAVMLGSLLMAAALPEAFGERALLFAASYVGLQVGRNAAAAWLLTRRHRLRDVFERLVVWSAASGVLWLAGAALDSDQRLILWIPALALELAAPAAGYWLPGRGRAVTTDYDIEGSHFAERCQVFIIIALGESIVVTGATASAAGLTSTVVLCLIVAFVETAALWWLYFGATTEHARVTLSTLRRPRSPRARRLHLRASSDRRGHHRDRGRQQSADRRAAPGARRGRCGDDPRRPRALPARREPVLLADDRRDERQAPGGRGTAHPACAGRRPGQRPHAQPRRRCAASLRSRSGSGERPACSRSRAPRSATT